ncbi:MAG: ATP-binding protein [Betaproteobacteria bacterium]|nr:ATP-binding protein [Betaproteobacteria bacterium]MCL2885234.1 ATP-binding protein [Betaproteobacteria bacterium]
MDEKEKQVILYYLNNLSKSSLPGSKEDDLLTWVEWVSQDLLGRNLEKEWDLRGRAYKLVVDEDGREMYVSPDHGSDEEEAKKLPRDMKTLRGIFAGQAIVDITREGYDKSMDALFAAFGIEPDFQAVLRYMTYGQLLPLMRNLYLKITGAYKDNRFEYGTFSAAANVPTFIIEKSFNFDSPLLSNGVVIKDNAGNIGLSDSFHRVLRSTHDSVAEIRKILLGEPPVATLRRDNFKYIEDDYLHIRAILGNAIKEGRRGVNILLYGLPGTGKSELCKTLAKDIGVDLYAISENSGNNRAARASDLSLGETLLAGNANAVIMFDEAEDVFCANQFSEKQDSKLYFNRILERNKTPVIWITNNIEDMDAAYIRRFAYALEVKKPDQAAKRTIWQNICARHHVELSDERIADYARRYDVAPAFIDTAVGAAQLVKSADAIERTIDSLQKATLGYIPRKKDESGSPFMPELLNADTDLSELAERLVSKSSRRFSLCLYGAPGTGKSAFARHLAELLGLEVIQKRASDLMSRWVGGTERNIAQAFNEAHAARAMLIFDEADSFLRDRKGAHHGWEISQVNEMLTWMESHPYPFICTTNLMQELDEASLRRFTFKVEYGFLKLAQVELAFRHFFGAEAEMPLSHLTHLTPGDFAVVKGKQDILDITDKPELVRMLELEQAAKGVRMGRMGFV